tara:strand:+ start:4263 stop:4772 length:510 start_codon:yes stop_codon:yes gene_type:complete
MLTISERNTLVLNYLPLAHKIACNKKRTVPSHVDLDELKSAAYLGLVDAASRYNTKYNFAPYASIRISGAISDFLRELGWGSRAQYTVICCGDDSPLDWLASDEATKEFEEITECLLENERQILSWYYIDNYTMKEIGNKLSRTESRVSQIISESKEKIKHQMGVLCAA